MQKAIAAIVVLGLILSSIMVRLTIHNFIIEGSKEKASIIKLKGQV